MSPLLKSCASQKLIVRKGNSGDWTLLDIREELECWAVYILLQMERSNLCFWLLGVCARELLRIILFTR
jgi:hypothetical protein